MTESESEIDQVIPKYNKNNDSKHALYGNAQYNYNFWLNIEKF